MSREAHRKKGTGEGRKRKRTEREGRRERGGEGAESCPIGGKRKQNKASSIRGFFLYPILTSIYFDIRSPLLKLIDHLLFLIAGNQQLKLLLAEGRTVGSLPALKS